MDIIAFISFYNWNQEAAYEFEQRQMDIQVNYAINAAAQEMLNSGTHIGTDYADWGEMTVEPEIALDTYLTVMMRGLGWSDTQSNRDDLIESGCKFFIVAGYDGYYAYNVQRDTLVIEGDRFGLSNDSKQVVYDKKWTPKIPYCDTVVSDTNKLTLYLYNLKGETYNKYSNGKLEYNIPVSNLGVYGTTHRSKTIIAEQLTQAVNACLYQAMNGNITEEFFLPRDYSNWAENNPVVSPTCITYMTRTDGRTMYETVTFGVGAAKIDDAQFFICYEETKNGTVNKWYTYAENRSYVEDNTNNRIIEIVPSMKQAAQKGYYYDVRYLGGVNNE